MGVYCNFPAFASLFSSSVELLGSEICWYFINLSQRTIPEYQTSFGQKKQTNNSEIIEIIWITKPQKHTK